MNQHNSSSVPNLEALIARAETARDELRETIREAHGMRSDLRQAIKEAKEHITKAISDHIDAVVTAGLDEYQQSLQRAIKRGRLAIIRKFDQMVTLMLNPKDQRTRALWASVQISTILETIAADSIQEKEAVVLLLQMKADPDSVGPERLEHLLTLLRPLVEEPGNDDASTG